MFTLIDGTLTPPGSDAGPIHVPAMDCMLVIGFGTPAVPHPEAATTTTAMSSDVHPALLVRIMVRLLSWRQR
jgi:hypothetical protein